MTPDASRRIILGSLLVAVLATEVERVSNGKGPTAGPIIAGAVAAGMLTSASAAAPEVAAQLAIIAALTALMRPDKRGGTVGGTAAAAVAGRRSKLPGNDAGRYSQLGRGNPEVEQTIGLSSLLGSATSSALTAAQLADLPGAFSQAAGLVTWRSPFGDTLHTSPAFAAKLRPLMEAAKADGVTIRVTGSGRTKAQQLDLRRQHGCGNGREFDHSCKGSPPTAVPGTSRHETGDAVDIVTSSANLAWLRQHAGTFGVYNLASEPWHWSTDGS